jgi:catechol 2,3-dioxygenase-like lactoylglutathione lyase family enzyme
MTVRRIVANLAVSDPGSVREFYEKLLDLKVVMDHGWILTFACYVSARPELSVASEGGSGKPVPDLPIEVDDVDEVYRRARSAGYEITNLGA